MYLSPKSSSSSICLLRDWARSHLYSLPGLTICNPSNKLWSFLDRLFTSNTLLYSKTGPARQMPTLQKSSASKFRQTTRTIAPFAEISTSAFSNKSTSPLKFPAKLLHKTLFGHKIGRTRRVHNPVTPFAKYSLFKHKIHTRRVHNPVIPFAKIFKLYSKVTQAS